MPLIPNALYNADCLALLERIEDECATLVYLDLPFDAKVSGRPTREAAQLSFLYEPLPPLNEYVEWLSTLMYHAYRVTSRTGNTVLHAEPTISSYIRVIAEDLFDDEFEFAEVIIPGPWRKYRHAKLRDEHTTLLIGRKSTDSVWHEPVRQLTQEELRDRYWLEDERGRFRLVDLTIKASPGARSEREYKWHEYVPPPGRAWRYRRSELDLLHASNRIHFLPSETKPYLKQYADEASGERVGNIWGDLVPRQVDDRKPHYDIRQPLALMERVIAATTDEGDLVIDPLCGTGTTLLAAQILGRKWLACDRSALACDLTLSRLPPMHPSASNRYTFGRDDELASFPVVASLPPIKTRMSNDGPVRFVHGHGAQLEETLTCELKEVKGGNPVGSIGGAADIYAVAFLNRAGGRIYWGIRDEDKVVVGVSLDHRLRDEVRKAIENALTAIQPPVAPSTWALNFHPVYRESLKVPDLYVVELVVPPPASARVLYGTGKGDVFVKTNSGRKKLSHIELQEEVLRRNNAASSPTNTG